MWDLKIGNSLDVLKEIPKGSIHGAITSPPYWNLREYYGEGAHWDQVTFTPGPGSEPITVDPCFAQLGAEPDPNAYIGHLIQIFRGVYDVLHPDGTLWVNIGDTYLKSNMEGVMSKSLCGIPWRFALAMQSEGWCLRNDIIWHKTRVLPSGAKDRFTTDHEYLFFFTKKSKGYYFDNEAVKEPCKSGERDKKRMKEGWARQGGAVIDNHEPTSAIGAGSNIHAQYSVGDPDKGRNRRTTWSICPSNYRGEHFATFPKELATICIKAATSEAGACPTCLKQWVRVHEDNTFVAGCEHDVEPVPSKVLDPFAGAGTTLLVSESLGRDSVGIEISPDYAKLVEERIHAHLLKELGPLDPDYPKEEVSVTEEEVDFASLFG